MSTMKNKDYHIFLIGFMGAGKSTVAEKLREKLQVQLVEMDQQIVDEQQMEIADIFEKYGEAYFRNLETTLLRNLQNKAKAVISCGGGVVMREENLESMKKSGYVVLLTAEPETIYERVKDTTNRPLLNQDMSVSHIRELMDVRRPHYEAAADLVVTTDNKQVDEICSEIITKLDQLNTAQTA